MTNSQWHTFVSLIGANLLEQGNIVAILAILLLCDNANISWQILLIVGRCLATKGFIGKLPATGGVWVIIE